MVREIASPYLLQQIPDPPKKLFCFGNERLLNQKIIAVVGSRNITDFGYKATVKIVKSLLKKGYTIISGMAIGVDATAHWAAITQTIAVLGAGVDIIYPPENKNLYFEILKNNGAIISEIPPGKLVPREKFAARNRIISGLAEGVIIPEANLHSGSMITARLALDQGKDVYCVPGSLGCDYLIEMGAKIIRP